MARQNDLKQALAAATSPVERTRILQQTIDATGEQGGGLVELPSGEWVIVTIFLRSGVRLHLQRGCVLKAHDNLDDYPTAPRGHNKDRQPYHLIMADGCEHVTVEGDGVIDGNGKAFWEPPIRDLRSAGKDVTDDIARAPERWPIDGPFWRAWGPRITPLIELRHCKHVVLRDFTIVNSPGWTVHPFCCRYVRIEGLTLDNHMYGPNTDGLDINGCQDVFVSNCRIAGCDDAIILKATEDAQPCERIVVTNCVLRTNCAALGLGAEVAAGIRDVTMSNCVVEQALRMIQIEMWEPGLVENVTITNISGATMTEEAPVEKVVYLDIQQHGRPEPTLGTMRNIVISNITATTRGRCVLTAQDGSYIDDVTLRDIQLIYPEIEDNPVVVPKCKSNQNSNYSPHSRTVNSVLVADNVRGLVVDNLSARMPAANGSDVPAMHGVWLRNVSDALIDSPRLRSNDENTETFALNGCDATVR